MWPSPTNEERGLEAHKGPLAPPYQCQTHHCISAKNKVRTSFSQVSQRKAITASPVRHPIHIALIWRPKTTASIFPRPRYDCPMQWILCLCWSTSASHKPNNLDFRMPSTAVIYLGATSSTIQHRSALS